MSVARKPTKSAINAPSEDALQVFVGYRVRRAWLAIQADLLRALKPFDLRMLTYTSLALVSANPGLSQAQLAALMDMERPNLVAIIDELQQRGLLVRERSTTDKRAYALHLTDAGQTLKDAATDAVQEHERGLTKGLPDASRNDLQTALDRIRANAENKEND